MGAPTTSTRSTGGGGGTITGGGTATQVAFWSGATAITGDNGLYWDNTSKFLGIGTITPVQGVDVEGATQNLATVAMTLAPTSAGLGCRLQLRAANGTLAAPSALAIGDEIGILQFRGYGTSYQRCAEWRAFATEAFAAGVNGARMEFLTTPNTTGTPQVRLRIEDSGNVQLNTTLAATANSRLIFNDGAAPGTKVTSFRAPVLVSAAIDYILPTTLPAVNDLLKATGVAGADVTLAWAAGGGGTPSAPVKSVQFNTAGAFDGDAELSWDTTNKRLGVGTDTPMTGADIEVRASTGVGTALPVVRVNAFSTSALSVPSFAFGRSRGTSPSVFGAILLDDALGIFDYVGDDGTGVSVANSGAQMFVLADENWSGAGHGATYYFATAAAGSTILNTRLIIGQNISATGNVWPRLVQYTWPAAFAAGQLTSDAGGVLSWASTSSDQEILPTQVFGG